MSKKARARASKEARAWIETQLALPKPTLEDTAAIRTDEQYATALKHLTDVNPLFELGPGVWEANRLLVYKMLRTTFESSRDAHGAIEATSGKWRERCFDARFKRYVHAVSDLVRPAVFDLLKALSAIGSDRKVVPIVWTQMTDGLIRPVVDHLLTIWVMWTINGATEHDFEDLTDQYEHFRDPCSPCEPPKPIAVAGPKWMSDPPLEFMRVTLEGRLQPAVTEAIKRALNMEHHEVESLRPLKAADTGQTETRRSEEHSSPGTVSVPVLSRREAKRQRDGAIRRIWGRRPKKFRDNSDLDYEYVCREADRERVTMQGLSWPESTWIANFRSDAQVVRGRVKKCIQEAIKPRKKGMNLETKPRQSAQRVSIY